jgi:hypothetical protein
MAQRWIDHDQFKSARRCEVPGARAVKNISFMVLAGVVGGIVAKFMSSPMARIRAALFPVVWISDTQRRVCELAYRFDEQTYRSSFPGDLSERGFPVLRQNVGQMARLYT